MSNSPITREKFFAPHSIEDLARPLAMAQGGARDNLIVSTQKVNGRLVVLSLFGDDIWWLTGFTSITTPSNTKIDFSTVPTQFRETLKLVIHRYRMRGSEYRPARPKSATVLRIFREIVRFLVFLEHEGVKALSLVSSKHYDKYRSSLLILGHKKGEMFSKGGLEKCLRCVELLCELSRHTNDTVTAYPSYSLGKIGEGEKTPLITDEIFSTIFQSAWAIVEDGERLLKLRDETEKIAKEKPHISHKYVTILKSEMLKELGFPGGFKELKESLLRIRIACYIVIASLSGCRVHELGNLKSQSVYSTTDADGLRYFWMRSKSEKTNIGETEWMIPEAAAQAINLLEVWAEPYQEKLREEISQLRAEDEFDLRIAAAERHLDSLFVGRDYRNGSFVRTLGVQAINNDLKDFCEQCGLTWNLSSHQFRKKFANYAARSQFGDLRYLQAHFKHWSLDMTLSYALNESQEIALYLDIVEELDDLKEDIVANWLAPDELLTGGYGESLVDWRSRQENIILFKSRADMVRAIAMTTHIRSNGHAWCTADDYKCPGNEVESTKCAGGCSSSVIGQTYSPFYQGLYDHLKELVDIEDIGPGGRERVKRDLNRCAYVLARLNGKANAS